MQVISAWRNLTLQGALLDTQKLDFLGETNYRKILYQTFNAWAKIVKHRKYIKKIGDTLTAVREEHQKHLSLKAWKRVLYITEISKVFQNNWKKKQGFKAFVTYKEQQFIKEALYAN